MILGAALVTLLAGASSSADFEVQPRTLAWGALSAETFDLGWVLPEPRTAPGRDLLAEMRRLLALRFDVTDEEGRRHRCFGDLVAVARELPPPDRRRWLDELEARAPALARDWDAGLVELLFDQRLATERWSPEKEHPNDGLLAAEPWPIGEEASGPWSDLPGKPSMEQCAALIHADVAALKGAENDYRRYTRNVGADYEEIYPLEDYFVGIDPTGRPFSTMQLLFRCDLPFPFSDYTTRLRILNRFDAAGVLYTDIYSTSEDFHWLAGRDVLLPVTTFEGDWVCFLLVRHFGFDLDGVPDGPGDRRVALRGALGNLKRNAERLYAPRAAAGEAPRNAPEVLREVSVLGRR